jgi:NTE family protein
MVALKPHTIVLSGGGVRALAHIGALQHLHNKGILTNVRKWIGLSAGALVAFALTIGYSLHELRDICERIDFEILQDLEEGLPFSFFDKLGLDTGCRLKKFLTALLTVKAFQATTTFQMIKERHLPSLEIYATDLHTGDAKCFNSENTPHTPIVDALRASMSLPVYFQPVIDSDTGHQLTDGAILGMYPRAYIQAPDGDPGILGLLLIPKIDYTIMENNIKDYILRIFNIFCESRNKEQYERFKTTTILIETDSMSPVDFKMTPEIRSGLFNAGEHAAANYLSRCYEVKQPIKRRHSL